MGNNMGAPAYPYFHHCFWGLFLSLTLYFMPSLSVSTSHVYVVYLGRLNQLHDPLVTKNQHLQLLSNVFTRKEEAEKSMVYSYKHSFSGFSATLNSTQAATLSKMDGVVSVFRSRVVKLHTTRSWDFLGLRLTSTTAAAAAEAEATTTIANTTTTTTSSNSALQPSYGDGIIVGVFDTGVWPESESFGEAGELGPVPKSWKGKCVAGDNFNPSTACNRKLIGARYYLNGFEQEYGPLNTSSNSEYRSARDVDGHGTHTASTAVGSIVAQNANFLGVFAKGVARGGAPRARLAVYKVCWSAKDNQGGKCTEADIMAAFDDALCDGVDVISASFGLLPPLPPFFASSADIGSFHAMQKGVSVVFSAGNDGPDPSLVQNVAPWSICVAASSIDRTFPTQILLLDADLTFMGEGLIVNRINDVLADSNDYFVDGVCKAGNLRRRRPVGKVILCFSTVGPVSIGMAQEAARRANASALIFVQPFGRQFDDVDIIPTVRLDLIRGTQIYHYLVQSFQQPAVRISQSVTAINKAPAPVVASFSSRGPSSLSPHILKPDITAPGINILAAWPPKTPPTSYPMDGRSVKWNFLSGTSMSCPHVSGVVALLKSAHPDWSPAAIRSALITTAYARDNAGDSILYGGITKTADPLDVGAGHIDPLRAMDPGLVYDLSTCDYIFFLCNIGYTEDIIENIVSLSPAAGPGNAVSCPKASQSQMSSSNSDLNYPSITVPNLHSTLTLKRTVRNVGRKKTAIYFATVVKPNGVEVVVWPRVLIFSCFKEHLSYYVTLKPLKKSQGRYDFGEIVWSDGFHSVRSPLAVLANTATACGDDSYASA